ncbi:MAG TPA: tyrosine--tRNA ligase [Candidatus Doudnabacteria bacterium]|nr:tyrosine--tRNA ligase [Candidatus Doudnabacteria bacterium]
MIISNMNKDQQIKEILHRTVAEVIHPQNLLKKLKSHKRLRIKLGIDPTSQNIHIGRAVVLRKLRAFQDLGHKAVLIIGDFTGQIGDTSDKDAERPMLTEKEVKSNLKNYLAQAFQILDKSKTEFYYNSKWLKKLGFAEISNLANLFSVHEFIARENIKKRLDVGKRVSLREILYPLMQGYDSIMVKADVELGGTDQRFNMLAGRTIQQALGLPAQDVVMVDLLEGIDGRKMSSSWGNTINLSDKPSDMFGKVMSIDDKLIEKYFVFTTNLAIKEIEKILKVNQHPRDQKLILAERVVALYYNDKQAQTARENFIKQFSKKELPDDIKSVSVKSGKYLTTELLVKLKLTTSKSEARRLLEQSGVKVNQKTFTSKEIEIKQKNNLIIQVGKRKFVRIR